MKKKVFVMALSLVLGTMLLAGCGKDKTAEPGAEAAKDTPAETEAAAGDAAAEADGETAAEKDESLLTGKHKVEIEIETYGKLTLELDADAAPISTTNFIELAKAGFYDGLTFHRIISGFMIQGGDPLGTGVGGSDKTIKGEFSNNGVENSIKHTRGVISMARSQEMDSASSQFFIVQQDSDFLDGDYAAFGHVTEGMEIVDQICEDTAVTDNNGTVAAENQPKITKITVVE